MDLAVKGTRRESPFVYSLGYSRSNREFKKKDLTVEKQTLLHPNAEYNLSPRLTFRQVTGHRAFIRLRRNTLNHGGDPDKSGLQG
jgi:hypothetical protein